MKHLAALFFLFASCLAHAQAITCDVLSDGNVLVKMKTPHPEHALVYRPDDSVVWLQSGPEYIHQQIGNFGELEEWLITPESKGTVWGDGGAEVRPILQGRGRYHLYIANNIETEPENTYFIECFFVIENRGPRMVKMDPYAWRGLPMETLIADFQLSDGVFSSFICDELTGRLVADPSGSLQALNAIDKPSRIKAFKSCLHPEVGFPAGLLEGVNKYSEEYPQLIHEINVASDGETDIPWIEMQGERFYVEVVEDSKSRSQGLMYRELLAADSGMVFIYPSERVRNFWMKNTLIPLDIIFLDSQLRIVSIVREAPPCEKELCDSYSSQHPAMYVVEVNAGIASSLGLEPGDIVRFSETLEY